MPRSVKVLETVGNTDSQTELSHVGEEIGRLRTKGDSHWGASKDLLRPVSLDPEDTVKSSVQIQTALAQRHN